MERTDDKSEEAVPEEVVRVVEVSSVNDVPIKLTPTGKVSHAKTRVYTQRYRKEWEHMIEFKDWLTSVPGQPTRAYCEFCSRNLHAHRLSLLKHMCTLKHQRSAVQFSKRVGRMKIVKAEDTYDNSNYNSDDEEEEMLDESHMEEMEASDGEVEEEASEGANVEKNKQDTLSQAMAHVISESNNDMQLEMVVESENDENDENYENDDNDSQVYEVEQLDKSNDNLEEDERTEETEDKDEKVQPIIISDYNDLPFDSKRMVLVSSVDGKSYTVIKGSFISKAPVPKSLVNKQVNEDETSTASTNLKANVIQVSNKDVASKNELNCKRKNAMVTTHILDTSRGLPISGLQVLLYKLSDGRWSFVHESTTTVDGMCNDFLKTLPPGRYKFHYDVEKYYNSKKIVTSFPFIEIVFDIKDPHKTYHIPLLLSPYGYSTHRTVIK